MTHLRSRLARIAMVAQGAMNSWAPMPPIMPTSLATS